MSCFRSQRDEIPEHVWILQVRLWISLLGVNEAWEENWIPNEENWRVVTNNIPNTIVCVEFNSETSWITRCVGTTALTTYLQIENFVS